MHDATDTRTTVRIGRDLLGAAACADLEAFIRERAPAERRLVARVRALWEAFDHAPAGDQLPLWRTLGRLGREAREAGRP